MSSDVAQRIRAARAYGRKSQPALAEILEVSEGTVKNIELGKRRPKRSELLAIAEACEVPMWFLEGGWEGHRESSVDATASGALEDIRQRRRERRGEA